MCIIKWFNNAYNSWILKNFFSDFNVSNKNIHTYIWSAYFYIYYRFSKTNVFAEIKAKLHDEFSRRTPWACN